MLAVPLLQLAPRHLCASQHMNCDVKPAFSVLPPVSLLPRLASRTALNASSCKGGWAVGLSTGFWPTSIPSSTHPNAGPGSLERQVMIKTKCRERGREGVQRSPRIGAEVQMLFHDPGHPVPAQQGLLAGGGWAAP